MQDLPPESMDEEPLIPYVEEAQEYATEIIQDEIVYPLEEAPVALFPLEKDHATRADLFRLAHFLHEAHSQGITWKDYATMIDTAIDYLASCTQMSNSDKRNAIVTTLNYVIAQIEMPFLPEGTFEPLFESLLIPFIDLALETRSGCLTVESFREERPTIERLRTFAQGMTHLWQSSLNWDDFAQATRLSIAFLLTFEDTSRTDLCTGMRDILQMLVETTAPHHLPEDFNEEIFYAFTGAFSEVIIPLEPKNGSL